MFYKYCVWLLLVFLISCSSHRKLDENKILITSVSTEKFKKFYALCRKEEDTIYVYNNTEEFRNCPSINIGCNKTIVIRKSVIEIDVNSVTPKENKIVLHKFEKSKNIYKLHFLNIQTNGMMIMNFNGKNELLSYESGAY
ncbi:hypothetical protein [Flavobacterium pedocola]